MGFYGKVTNINNTSFVFDKIYPNRYMMDNKCVDDGVFVGRFVLVEYDNDPIIYYKKLYTTDNTYFYFNSNNDINSIATYVKTPADVSNDFDIYQGEIIYIEKTSSGKVYYEFWKCDSPQMSGSKTNIAHFTRIVNGIGNKDNDKYTYNYQIDMNCGNYAQSRGFDSTVWQKVYQNGHYKYVQIAELNSVVPTFALFVDPPTQMPIQPHFDKDQTSVYYPLHVQPSWGLRVKSTTDSSDIEVKRQVAKYDENSNYISTSIETVPADIYFNKAGFDKNTSTHSNESDNKITLEPTGQSGAKYHNHNYPYRDDQVANDIFEFSARLPAIGNAIADVYDVLGGVDESGGRRWTDTENVDTTNVTGALNALKYKFNSLDNKVQNKLLFVGKQSCEHGISGYQIEEADIATDKWLNVVVDSNGSGSSTDGSKLNGDIIIKHIYPHTESDTKNTLDLNSGDFNTLDIQTSKSDETGHIINRNTQTVTLPYGFKIISTNGVGNSINNMIENADKIIAKNIKDILNINSDNKWLKIKVDNNSNEIRFAHELHQKTTSTSSDNKIGNEDENRSFIVYNYSFDEAGHISNEDTKTIHLPLAYGKLSGDIGSTDASTNHDEISLVGDSWIGSAAEKDKIVFSHKKAQTAVIIKGESVDKTLAFGDQFKVIQAGIDTNGHVSTLNEYTMSLPKGKYEESESGSAKVITSLSFVDTTGALTGTYKNIGALNLTGYTEGNVNTDIAATDSINAAFGKLQHQIHSMDYTDTVNENQIINAINEINGLITPVRINITSKKLGGYSLGSSTASISDGDTLGTALGKIQSNLNIINGENAGSIKKALKDAKEYTNTLIANIVNADNNGKIDKLNEVFAWIGDNKDATSIISDIQANKEAIDKLTGSGDGSVSNDINSAITEVKGADYKKGTLKSHEDAISAINNNISNINNSISSIDNDISSINNSINTIKGIDYTTGTLKSHEDLLTKLNGDESTDGSISKQIKDSLVDLQTKSFTSPEGMSAATIEEAIAELYNKILALEEKINNQEENPTT